MKRLIALLVLLLAPMQARAAVRAVFVGVDTYLYSQKHVPENAFEDLEGAVDDALRIKEAMRVAYAIDFDRPVAGKCLSQNAVSITLTDACATHDAVIAALKARIAASAKGDTVIFYFAGHGAQTDDGTFHDQPSKRNDTILPADAREPDAPARDILDHDLRVIINDAVARGVNFVSVFDSCHSGTATRGFSGLGRKRSAPDLAVAPSADVQPIPGPGYWVHFGASTDSEESYEIALGGKLHGGVFTAALIATLAQPRLAAATYGDIGAAVQLAVRDTGHVDQHPQVEGDLNATLMGGAGLKVPLFAATPAGKAATLGVGRLSGVSVGSTYALFADRARALDPKAPPLVTGRVVSADLYAAALALDAVTPGAKPLIAREVEHAYGDRQLRVAIAFPVPDLQRAVEGAVKRMPFATLAEPPQVVLERRGSEKAKVGVYMADGSPVDLIPPVSDPDFAGKLGDALRRVARVQALLALRTDPTQADMIFCIDNLPPDAPCAPAAGLRVDLTMGQPVRVTLINTADRARHVYVYGIDEANNVRLIMPIAGTDDPLPAHSMLPRNQTITPKSPGRYMFLALASDQAIDAEALQQGARGAEVCGGSALARLMCDANSGTRDAAVAVTGAWSALVVPGTVAPPKITP